MKHLTKWGSGLLLISVYFLSSLTRSTAENASSNIVPSNNNQPSLNNPFSVAVINSSGKTNTLSYIVASKMEQQIQQHLTSKELRNRLQDNLLTIQKLYKDSSETEKQFINYILERLPFDSISNQQTSIRIISEIFKGAQVHIPAAEHYQSWLNLGPYGEVLFSREGTSSHSSIKTQHSIRGKLLKENLFGTRIRANTNQEYTWFQLERHPAGSNLVGLSGYIDTINNIALHLVDYTVYKYTNQNVGPFGTSKYKENSPLYLDDHFSVKDLKPSREKQKYWTDILLKPSTKADDSSKKTKKRR